MVYNQESCRCRGYGDEDVLLRGTKTPHARFAHIVNRAASMRGGRICKRPLARGRAARVGSGASGLGPGQNSACRHIREPARHPHRLCASSWPFWQAMMNFQPIRTGTAPECAPSESLAVVCGSTPAAAHRRRAARFDGAAVLERDLSILRPSEYRSAVTSKLS